MHLGIAYAVVTTKKPTAIPVYEITTRGNLDKPQGVSGSGYANRYHLLDIKNL
jgi:hypothetical protein